jgi:hypothetical protein
MEWLALSTFRKYQGNGLILLYIYIYIHIEHETCFDFLYKFHATLFFTQEEFSEILS